MKIQYTVLWQIEILQNEGKAILQSKLKNTVWVKTRPMTGKSREVTKYIGYIK